MTGERWTCDMVWSGPMEILYKKDYEVIKGGGTWILTMRQMDRVREYTDKRNITMKYC